MSHRHTDSGCDITPRDDKDNEREIQGAAADAPAAAAQAPHLQQVQQVQEEAGSRPQSRSGWRMHLHTPREDPHKLQLQQGELRHGPEAQGPAPAPAPAPAQAQAQARGSPAPPATPPEHHWQRPHWHRPLFRSSSPAPAAPPAAASTTSVTSQPRPEPYSWSTASAAPPSDSRLDTEIDPLTPLPSSSSATPASVISRLSSSSSGTSTPAPRIIDRDQIRTLASGEPSPTSSGFATPTEKPRRKPFKSLRPFIRAIMAFEKGRKFSTGTSVHRKRQMSTLVEREGHFGPALTVCQPFCLPLPSDHLHGITCIHHLMSVWRPPGSPLLKQACSPQPDVTLILCLTSHIRTPCCSFMPIRAL